MPYREAPPVEQRKEIFRHRSTHPLLQALITVGLLLMACGALSHGGHWFRSIRVECPAASYECTIIRRWVVFTDREVIRRIGMTAGLQDRKGRYAVVTLGRFNTAPDVLTRSEPLDEAEARRAALEALLSSRGGGTLDVEAPAVGSAIFTALFALGIASLSLLFNGSASLELDFMHRTVRHRKHHWPLRTRERVFRVDEIERARVLTKSGTKGTSYTLALETRDEVFDLAPQGGSHARNVQAANRVNELLRRLREA